jgi:hypothetical protein
LVAERPATRLFVGAGRLRYSDIKAHVYQVPRRCKVQHVHGQPCSPEGTAGDFKARTVSPAQYGSPLGKETWSTNPAVSSQLHGPLPLAPPWALIPHPFVRPN